jgi:opacity protein-like surface antigen
MFSGAVMKKLATCLIGVVGLIGTPAFAADMAVKARPLPAPAPVFSWTGCYLGGYAGGAWHESDGAISPISAKTVSARRAQSPARLSCLIRAAPSRRGSYRNIRGAPTWTALSLAAAHSAAIGSGGVEWAFAQSWSVKAEYMFIALDDHSGFQTCGPVTTPAGRTLAGGPFCFNNTFSGIHTAKIGLNYRFGTGY